MERQKYTITTSYQQKLLGDVTIQKHVLTAVCVKRLPFFTLNSSKKFIYHFRAANCLLKSRRKDGLKATSSTVIEIAKTIK